LGRSLEIAARDGATVCLEVNAVTGKRLTQNVLADTVFNSDSSLIIVGAHLDSVPEGPGINDNGSGSAVVLEAALRIGQGTDPGPRWCPLRILGRRGARPHRLPPPCGIPVRGDASAHRVVYQPRYGRLA